MQDSLTLSQALWRLFHRPGDTLIRQWNWKSAVFSSTTRAMLFFFTNLSAGWRAATGAMLAEFLFRATTAGFYGALTQNFRKVAPAWKAAVTVMILLPLSSHSLEFLVHWLRHTPKLTTSIVTSVVFTAISTLFNWFAMRKGAMVVGSDSRSIGSDMRAMPLIVGQFCAALPVFCWRTIRKSVVPGVRVHEPQDAAFD